jgi:hypothetical protein
MRLWLACNTNTQIFTRWLNQKLALRGIKIDSCVTDLKGEVLVELIEILSEKSFGTKRYAHHSNLAQSLASTHCVRLWSAAWRRTPNCV